MKCSYRIAEHPVYRFPMPVIDSSMYVVPADGSCLIVDPCVSAEAEELLKTLGVRACTVLLTHEHFDHISGVNRLRELFACEVVCTEVCARRLEDPRKNGAAYIEALVMSKSKPERKLFVALADPQYVCRADHTYSKQMKLRWADMELTLLEAPGHSPGSQIIEIGKRWYFTGDSYIPGEKVITRLPGGSRREYEAVTRQYLNTIAPGSVLFPGHGGEALVNGPLEFETIRRESQ